MDILPLILVSLITGGVTGLFTTFCTVLVLRNDIGWIKEAIRSHEHKINRAHERIDSLDCKKLALLE